MKKLISNDLKDKTKIKMFMTTSIENSFYIQEELLWIFHEKINYILFVKLTIKLLTLKIIDQSEYQLQFFILVSHCRNGCIYKEMLSFIFHNVLIFRKLSQYFIYTYLSKLYWVKRLNYVTIRGVQWLQNQTCPDDFFFYICLVFFFYLKSVSFKSIKVRT